MVQASIHTRLVPSASKAGHPPTCLRAPRGLQCPESTTVKGCHSLQNSQTHTVRMSWQNKEAGNCETARAFCGSRNTANYVTLSRQQADSDILITSPVGNITEQGSTSMQQLLRTAAKPTASQLSKLPPLQQQLLLPPPGGVTSHGST